ncbi:TPA: hypothetical protein EYP37_12540 [Candidatus Poribacteria bacterium]|nr:hypothetical protein [Candidatus Poribacteria bacterium]
MKLYRLFPLAVLAVTFLVASSGWALKEDCGPYPNKPPKPAKKVNKEDPNVQNDYDQVVPEDTRKGVTYLTFINGDQPKPNACGLNPKNDPNEWTGWGGPLNADNMTIGEGPGTRNEIVIGGVYFERGIGTHAVAKIVYDLTGGDWVKFEGYVGMADEKDPAECGHGGSCVFVFYVDGKEVFRSDVLRGTEGGKNVPPVKVELDVSGARELTIEILDGGDGIGCDHGAIGDAKLLTAAAFAVDPRGKLSTSWGAIKSLYR